MTTASISMRGVGRMYGATVALADVNLDLEPGVIGLLGPNGAGKTTLIRLLATALPPTGGAVRVLGRDPQVPAQRTDIRRRARLPATGGRLPARVYRLRVHRLHRAAQGVGRAAARHAEVRRVLNLVGLSDLATKRIRAMSGGQRRRVALAQALLGSPPVLILDEPTAASTPSSG